MKYIISITIVSLLLIAACGNPTDLNAPGNNMSGYVTTLNMNIIPGGYYSVSVFSADSTNPFQRIPVRTDSLNLKRRDDLFETTYDLDGIQPGSYYVAATWSRYPKVQNEVPMVLGIYGCDTSASCRDYKVVLYPNYEGVFRNITSWTDSTKRMN